MPTSKRWSSAFAPCRLEWRRSRLLASLLAVLGVFAAVAVLVSELPRQAALPLALAALLHAGVLVRRELCRPARALVIPSGPADATLDGQPIRALTVQWRGPLAFLHWRGADGRRGRMQGWPDTLDARTRRELRLAMAARVPARARRSMAP